MGDDTIKSESLQKSKGLPIKKKKRRLKKEAVMVISGLAIFMVFVILSIVIKKSMEFSYEKKRLSPVITVSDNIVTLKDFSYYIIEMENKGNEVALIYDESNPTAYWNLYMNDASDSGYVTDLARRTAINYCVRDNIYAIEAVNAGINLTEEELDEISYDAKQYYDEISDKGISNLGVDVLSLEKAMRTESLAYKYIAYLAENDEDGVLQSVVLKYDVGGKYYEALKNDYKVVIDHEILNEIRFGFVTIN